jgi:hypothetical protein
MSSEHVVRLALAMAAAAWVATACGAPEDPFTSGPAHATVTGVVTTVGGTAISATTVRIACAGDGSSLVAPTDSTGRYIANLETDSDPFDGSSGRLPCHFSEPAAGKARVEFDTSLGFLRGPVLVALQSVDLHEP